MSTVNKQCHCGSGERSYIVWDARGIPVGKACRKCEAKLRAKYRPEIFTDSQYECDEQIEEDC
jgi:hypothetical protein